MNSLKKNIFSSKLAIVIIAATIITFLMGASRVNLMIRLESFGLYEFDRLDYFFRLATLFIMVSIFLYANIFYNKVNFGFIRFNLMKPLGIISFNLLIFVPIQLLNVFITIQQAGPLQSNIDIEYGTGITMWPVISNLGLMLITVLIGTIYRFMQENYQIKLKNESLEKESAQARFANLKEQLNPHFLFNSFSTLNGLIDEAPEKAKNFLHNMSDVYRYVLKSEKEDMVLLEVELEFTQIYIDMIKERFGDAVFVESEIPDRAKEKKVLPLAIQMLIENAVKHNNFDEVNPLIISIVSNGRSITVKNKMSPRHIEQRHSLGLHILNQRYKYLSNREIIITKSDQLFTVEIPLL